MKEKVKKIVFAFDSFKGSVSSREICERLEKLIKSDFPNWQAFSFPIADGGEGTLEAIEKVVEGKKIKCRVHNPIMDEIDSWYIITNKNIAIIEMAQASGLTLLTDSRQNPMQTTTFGTGEMIADAIKRGCRKFIIGLGGSATNDAGIGALSALGYRFLDKNGNILETVGKSLIDIATIDDSMRIRELEMCEFTLACDVTNLFHGKNGAAMIYAPQKGATKSEIEILDKGLVNFAALISSAKNIDLMNIAGTGAAGGMAGGFVALLGAKIKSGSDMILDQTGFDDALDGATIVMTGEGKIDQQTVMGKAVCAITKKAAMKRVPVIALGGSIESVKEMNMSGITALFSIQQAPVSIKWAMNKKRTLDNIESTACQILKLIDNLI